MYAKGEPSAANDARSKPLWVGGGPSTDSFHTGGAIVYTRYGRPVLFVQAQHCRITPGGAGIKAPRRPPREEPLTRNRFCGDRERVHGASSGCWPSTESFHTGRAIVYTRPGQPVALMQAEHNRLLSCVRPHGDSSRDEPHTHNRIVSVHGDWERVYGTGLGC